MTWGDRTSELWGRLGDLVRRFLPSDTSDPMRWHVSGYVDNEGEETDELELFAGVGLAARPPSGANAEAIACAVNGRDQHVIVATRDADTLRAVVATVGLEADETVVFTSRAAVKITADGEVLIGRIGGEFKAVALADHTHRVPAITGQASYAPGPPAGPDTGPSGSNSSDTKVT
ncbi:phage baseplate assembly protein domain-containing protein [Haliangium sp.]|uniref:phage baseplate assembly protein domain-containing protein n=1 Tax=Haliangium sp. TaxID=2663208 RepID=UPI003D099A21